MDYSENMQHVQDAMKLLSEMAAVLEKFEQGGVSDQRIGFNHVFDVQERNAIRQIISGLRVDIIGELNGVDINS